MNENNIVSIDAVIDRIKICGYIDCNEHDGYYDEYEYDNILYYLEKYKNLQSKIDKAIEYCEYNDEGLYTFEPDYDYEENIVDNYEPSNFREDIMEILKEDK